MHNERIVIAPHERGLFIKDRSLTDVLEPGIHRVFVPLGKVTVEVHDVTATRFLHPQAETFAKTAAELMARHVHEVRTADHEAVLVFKDGVLFEVLAPASHRFYWKALAELDFETVDVSTTLEVPQKILDRLMRARDEATIDLIRSRAVHMAEVPDHHVGLLIVDGRLVRTLTPGVYAHWAFNRSVTVDLVDQRLKAMEVQGQELLTKHKVTLRVNLTASYQVTDPVKARGDLDKFTEYLYRELQFGLRQAFATRTLDALLENKGQLDQAILDHVREQALTHGITVTGVGVKDLILPGDMRELLNQVVEAEKVAQANVIKRREETAATRSLLNTARLMDENPTLLRLKELEALEKVADKVDRLTVFGGLDGVLNDTVRIGVKAD